MKLVQITTVSVSKFFIEGQPRFMRRFGISTVYITSPDPSLQSFGDREGCETRGVKMSRQISPIRDLASLWQLVRNLRDIRPDIVHAHTPKGGLLGMISARLARVPVKIYNIQGLTYMGQEGLKRKLMMMTERISCKLADQVICVSPSIAEVAVEAGLVPRHKIKVLANGTANGVDAKTNFNPQKISIEDRLGARAEINIDKDAIVTLFVGRLAIDKGIRELTSAWESIVAQYPDSVLVIVGAPDDRDPIDETTLQTLGKMASVRLVGQQRDVPKYYALADIFVLPTYREGYPTVLLEAAAMGLPAVSTSIPGCVDAIVEGETGLLVPAKDSKSLEAALGGLITDGNLRREMGTAARDRVVSNYEPTRLWNALLEEYRRLIALRGGAHQ